MPKYALTKINFFFFDIRDEWKFRVWYILLLTLRTQYYTIKAELLRTHARTHTHKVDGHTSIKAADPDGKAEGIKVADRVYGDEERILRTPGKIVYHLHSNGGFVWLLLLSGARVNA